MQLRGWARYDMLVDRSGRVLNVRLRLSTGYDMLDREGERILRAASPLPALPPDITGSEVLITVDIDIHP
jgi:protein TonB